MHLLWDHHDDVIYDLAPAGMQEGGLCLWDCTEAAQLHSQYTIGGRQLTSRRPTYSTECSGASAMTACVVAVSALPTEQSGDFVSFCSRENSIMSAAKLDWHSRAMHSTQ